MWFLRNASDVWNRKKKKKKKTLPKDHAAILICPKFTNMLCNTGNSAIMSGHTPYWWLAVSVFWYWIWSTFNSVSPKSLNASLMVTTTFFSAYLFKFSKNADQNIGLLFAQKYWEYSEYSRWTTFVIFLACFVTFFFFSWHLIFVSQKK